MNDLFISPHNDDAVLFGSFTLQRFQPLVLTVFDSVVQDKRGYPQCNAAARRCEDYCAMKILGCWIKFSGASDAELSREAIRAALSEYKPQRVWIPAYEEHGHPQHNLISTLAREVYSGAEIRCYLTYTELGKSTNGTKVPFTGVMLRKKLQALACYRTQIEIDALGCAEHFIRDQNEYIQ